MEYIFTHYWAYLLFIIVFLTVTIGIEILILKIFKKNRKKQLTNKILYSIMTMKQKEKHVADVNLFGETSLLAET